MAILILFAAAKADAGVESQDCSTDKLTVTTKAFRCLVKKNRRALSGGNLDTEPCHSTLVDAFERSEASGLCATVGDAEVAYQLAVDAMEFLLPALATEYAGETDPDLCTAHSLAVASGYAGCRSSRHARGIHKGVLAPDPAPYHPPRPTCGSKADAALYRVSRKTAGECQPGSTTFEAIGEAVARFVSYLPGVYADSVSFVSESFWQGVFTGADFSNSYLDGVNFEDADLSNAVFVGAWWGTVNLRGANLSGVDLSNTAIGRPLGVGLLACPASFPSGDWGCVNNNIVGPTALLWQADLAGADLENANLDNADLAKANLTGANLRGALLGHAGLRSANFTGADLTNAVLTEPDSSGVVLDGANLTGADMSQFDAESGWRITARNLAGCPAALPSYYSCTAASIVGPRTVLDGVDLSGVNLSGRSLFNSSMVGTNLSGANLATAYLRSADLIGANLTGADLSGADMGGGTVDLSAANLTGANLAGAVLQDVIWSATICPDGSNSDSVGGSCCGHHMGGAPATCTP